MTTIAEVLAEQPFFTGIDPDGLAFLAGCATFEHHRSGALIFAEGDPAEHCYLVRTGRVVLELAAPGRGGIGVATIEPSDLVGWSWLHAPYRWRLDARAAEETSLVAFDAACLRAKFEHDPRLGYEVMRRVAETVSRRLHVARFQLLDLYGAGAAPGATDAAGVAR